MHLLLRSLLLLLAGGLFFAFAGLVAIWAPDKSVAELSDRWARAPSQFISIADLKVHLRDEGPRDDPMPIVLLHGTSDSLHTWDGWTAVLAGTRRVIRFDQPGFGLTGPRGDDDYSVAAYTRFVQAVLDHLDVRRCVLVGNSLGGQVAWEAAIAMPARVARLVLVDAAGYVSQPQSVPLALPLAFRLATAPGISRLFEFVLPRGLVLSSLRGVYGDPAKVTPELVDRYYDMALRAGNRRALGYRMKAGQTDGSARIGKLKQPTLVMWGRRDHLIPLLVGERFARDIPGARLVVFDDLGHLPHQEDPLRTATELQKFLGENPPN